MTNSRCALDGVSRQKYLKRCFSKKRCWPTPWKRTCRLSEWCVTRGDQVRKNLRRSNPSIPEADFLSSHRRLSCTRGTEYTATEKENIHLRPFSNQLLCQSLLHHRNASLSPWQVRIFANLLAKTELIKKSNLGCAWQFTTSWRFLQGSWFHSFVDVWLFNRNGYEAE